MGSDRREFISMLGAALASWVVSGQGEAATPPKTPPNQPPHTCYAPRPPQDPQGTPQWKALRQCWLDLRDGRMQSYPENAFQKEVKKRHQDALEALVAAGVVRRAVADEMSLAFDQGIAHIRRSQATCYIALPPEYHPRHDLMQQAEMLAKVASQGQVAPETLNKARAALARDIEWLNQWVKQLKPGKLETVKASPAAAEAARLLVNLLLGK
ncbi:MAG: hypothetical protein KA419_11860 [Acidobacteria bacterium]|nr:hypothetical protein [Acidobacteriota bacterium]